MYSLNHLVQRLKNIKILFADNSLIQSLDRLNDVKQKFGFSGNNHMSNLSKNKNLAPKDEVIEFIKSMFSAMLLALIIRTFLLQPFTIPSESMLPTLKVGDFLFVSKYSYGYSNYSFPFAPNLFEGRLFEGKPKRGDVAVFRVVDDGNKDYIKRIIGLPGDTISFKNGSVIVNGKPALSKKLGLYGDDTIDPETIGAQIFEEKIDDRQFEILDVFHTPIDDTGDYIVPEGHYFVSGDNRDNSQDSRLINGPVGFVSADKLIGKAEFIFFSLRDARFYELWKWPFAIRYDRIFKKIN